MAEGRTKLGERNRNHQILLQKTGLRGTGPHHNHYIWRLRCNDCGLDYGANGSDFDLRKCPRCQSGAAGLELANA